jgi:L,D-peptidoglycan transpeptidase YkuD (ErfK/YbiS/YcfS/YnhG family)
MELVVDPKGWAWWGGRRMRCALGRAGTSAAKREGDGTTPVGRFPFRRVLYRPDREPPPPTRLTSEALTVADGWCDAPDDPAYNRPVRLPYPASAESLWRADGVYDLIVPLGYNDDPVRAGAGSAIFLHLARPDFAPTEGCVALARADLLAVLEAADEHARILVRGGEENAASP